MSRFLARFLAERDAKRKSRRSYNNLLRVRRVLSYRAARCIYRGGPMPAKRHARESSGQEVRHGQ